MKKVAVIGTGISGMAVSRMLRHRYKVTVFEAADRLGGHTNTVPVTINEVGQAKTYPVDTGFIVFNHRTYPAFTNMLTTLGVDSRPSDMSFSVRDDGMNLEYLGGNLKGLFAQKRNLIRPIFWRMIREVIRFYRECRELLDDQNNSGEQALGHWLREHRYSRFFVDEHLIPMAASIWSAPAKSLLNFPARFFVRFLANHGMIDLQDRPKWRTVSGGSQSYLQELMKPLMTQTLVGCPIQRVEPVPGGVRVEGPYFKDLFDEVVIAAHADQALRMRPNPNHLERDILGAFPYQGNEAVLHTDERLLPKRRAAWAAWNYYRPAQQQASKQSVTLTYNLNILQGHETDTQFLVSLNPRQRINPAKIVKRIPYAHPLFGAHAPEAQARHGEISGVNGIHYCGAYWGYGFHEDGLQSALRVGRALGVEELEE